METTEVVMLFKALHERFLDRGINLLAEVVRAGKEVGIGEQSLRTLVYALVESGVVPPVHEKPPPNIRPRLKEILEFVQGHVQENGTPPSCSEIASRLGLTPTNVYGCITGLRERGYLVEMKLPRSKWGVCLSIERSGDPSMDLALTSRQKRILVFVKDYQLRHGRMPTYTEIARRMGIRTPTVHRTLRSLALKGLVTLPGNGRTRGLKLLSVVPQTSQDS